MRGQEEGEAGAFFYKLLGKDGGRFFFLLLLKVSGVLNLSVALWTLFYRWQESLKEERLIEK